MAEAEVRLDDTIGELSNWSNFIAPIEKCSPISIINRVRVIFYWKSEHFSGNALDFNRNISFFSVMSILSGSLTITSLLKRLSTKLIL